MRLANLLKMVGISGDTILSWGKEYSRD
jgi:hypothetical protein